MPNAGRSAMAPRLPAADRRDAIPGLEDAGGLFPDFSLERLLDWIEAGEASGRADRR